MSVEAPSTGASAATPSRQTPSAELEVPKSSPQAVMQSPCVFKMGLSSITQKPGLPVCFFVSKLEPS
jgi:hypothetical protein